MKEETKMKVVKYGIMAVNVLVMIGTSWVTKKEQEKTLTKLVEEKMKTLETK